MDTEGFDRGCKIDVSVNLSHKSTGIHDEQFTIPQIADPEFEFVVLHPSYFLPGNAVLTVYDHDSMTANCKDYVVAEDQCLRESHDSRSVSLPPFRLSLTTDLPFTTLIFSWSY